MEVKRSDMNGEVGADVPSVFLQIASPTPTLTPTLTLAGVYVQGLWKGVLVIALHSSEETSKHFR